MRTFWIYLTGIIIISGLACAGGKKPAVAPQGMVSASVTLSDPLPFDPHIISDTLENGLVYYIRQNTKPEKRAELRLVVNAGSILENDDQQGLAHLCEHMAFNGTRNFEKGELVNYLESIGMRFGPEINAYTSFDETVYMLQIPTDSVEIVQTAFQVLEDWASALSFDSLEIEKERGVVIEEWRLGRGADARIRDQQLPVLLSGSRYADRLPIGKKNILETFSQQSLRQFYQDWYRPDLMAVVAVGDFDVDQIRQLITRHFSQLQVSTAIPPRKIFSVPPHAETKYAIASDPEARFSAVGVFHKMPVSPENTIGDYRQNLVEMLYHQMFNQRLAEIARRTDPPFLVAYGGKSLLVHSCDMYALNARTADNGILRGLDALLLEANRVKEFGFTRTELDRNKAAALRRMEQALLERDKTESAQLAAEYIRHFLIDEPVPGIENEYDLFQQLIPGITLDEVNHLALKWVTDQNRVILASYPEKSGVDSVNRNMLAETLSRVNRQPVLPYEDELPIAPLLKTLPEPGSIRSEHYLDSLEVTELELGNGIRVILKPTDFQNDEVQFTGFSPGGYSLVPDSLLVPAKTAVAVLREGGLGNLNGEQLRKLLTDKVVQVSPYIDEISEGISGSASPADLETMFQLIYLWFTEPRVESSAFLSLQERFIAFYQNRSTSPDAAYQDTITVTLTRHHPRYLPWTVEILKQMNPYSSLRIYRDRFADAGDFTIILVGNFEVEKIKAPIRQYLASLPALSRQESWRDVSYQFPDSSVYREVRKGLEEKSETSLFFTGSFEWGLENKFIANAMLEVLRIKLREQIRENLSGTYGVRVSGSFSRHPRQRYQITVSFGSDPGRVEELSREIFSQIDSLQSGKIDERDLNSVKEILRRDYESGMKENDYWLDVLENRYFMELDPSTILRTPEMIGRLTRDDIQNAARKYLDRERYVQIVLFPGAP